MEQDLREQLAALAQKQADLQEKLNRLNDENRALDADIRWVSRLAAKGSEARVTETEKTTPPPLPEKVAPAIMSKVTPETPPRKRAPKSTETQPPKVAPNKTSDKPAFNPGEWEINFGRVWLVRIGVLLLLTGLIFLSTYAYKNWLFNAGAGAKVTFFMAISLTLTGLGMWLEKRHEKFVQYGRVLASGGLAAGYYTIYAAHFTPSLKLIDSPVFAGLLLTLWAGAMLAYAVWKQSRVVAVMAIGLAFYGTVVNPAGWLSLFSALLLSSAGIWLMMRFKWVMIGLGTMLAAYVSHAFWLGGVYPQVASESVRLTYLACYWLLFTVALAMPQAKEMPGKIQRIFCAVNNIAAWQLTVFLIPQFTPHAQTGWISIGMGLLWLGLAAVAHRGKFWHHSLVPVFAYQGILVASFGVLLEATGYTRFLLLAVEACILMARARSSMSKLLRWVAVGIFVCALITASPVANGGVLAAWPSHAALALVCAGFTALMHFDVRRAVLVWGGDNDSAKLVPVLSALVTWIVLGYGVFNQWSTAAGVNGLWITTTSLLLVYLLAKKPRWMADVSLTSLIPAMAGIIWYVIGHGRISAGAALFPILGAAVFWYLSPRISEAWDKLLAGPHRAESPPNTALESCFSLALWIMVAVAFGHHLESPKSWLVLGGVLALVGHAAGEYTRRLSITVPALFFHAAAFAALAFYGTREPALGWMPSVMLLVHLTLTDVLWHQMDKLKLRGALSLGLVGTVGMHAFQEFDRPDLTMTALGLGLIAWAYHRKDHGMAMVGGVFPLIIACLSASVMHGDQDWLRYIPILATLGAHALLWRETKDLENWKMCRFFLIGSSLACLFLTSSMHVLESFRGSGLAICWALLAALLFTAGLALRCRPYRLIGLFWLAAAVLHVVFIDVMKLETPGRILSFITLGLVLLALGFLYNRFQETIRKFL
ncbi:hypothetical protein NT6N_31550 [Oceaniferula spumae]|uniref:DUF2339 domain-containing protein n=1 Tax=Oceaniferula spumae TaxID=2979115 RepID=A0AAT9FQ31_9BACT